MEKTLAAEREVADGTRTRNRQHHKLEHYQLCYCHRANCAAEFTRTGGGRHQATARLSGGRQPAVG